jgi:hypothetical protein
MQSSPIKRNVKRYISPSGWYRSFFGLGIQPNCLNVYSRSERGLPQAECPVFVSACEAEIRFLFPVVPFRCRDGASRFLKQQA